ncbi:uncharacterized protein N7496_009796 [Penicillium cataractarum]|uniref:Uncharacterized protein n=1 Tax=Penicillium cataractarum TaxID=2100454 RepID=A0A9W9RPL7_9EURO|nr:uncharacterized protein N7496_009796 [Penicillium cataractarum]KAJ5364083.1 hypothetical protein N7496_009796 [Penicillium cataractarum]
MFKSKVIIPTIYFQSSQYPWLDSLRSHYQPRRTNHPSFTKVKTAQMYVTENEKHSPQPRVDQNAGLVLQKVHGYTAGQ